MIQAPIDSAQQTPDIQDFVGLFVMELPLKVAAVEHGLADGNREETCRAALQLKGAARAYGFGDMALYAGRIEAFCRDKASSDELLERAVNDLVTCAEQAHS